MANRLAQETSPYLLQHAHNPVDWYPWGDEAFQKARREDKPVFLSIGYSSCHWCHVMERESFENDGIAAILNDRFVPVKVDREERPDVDDVYMTAVQLTTGRGGWPLSAFLLPDGRPFFAGTYFPPDDRHGRAGFRTLLTRLSEAWKERRDDIEATATNIAEGIAGANNVTERAGAQELSAELLARLTTALARAADRTHGGFGTAPKFPPHVGLAWLLEKAAEGNAEALTVATLTLDAMALGGIHDHLAGGFHRYSTDERWLVPHFEKMLYDNAQLLGVYARAHVVTGRALYRRVAVGIGDYLLREMRGPEGAFYSATDADSEGVEGKFFVWSEAEIREVLGGAAESFCDLYQVDELGNFHDEATGQATGLNILHLEKEPSEEEEALLAPLRTKLLERRAVRVPPGLDDKRIGGWNALAISGFAVAGHALGEERFLDAARRTAGFLLETARDGQGRLLRTWKDGGGTIPAFLEDEAYFLNALLDLEDADGAEAARWRREATKAGQSLLDRFRRRNGPGFTFSGEGHEELLTNGRDLFDKATPSASAAAVRGLLRLAARLKHQGLAEQGAAALQEAAGLMGRSPHGTETWHLALAELLEFEKQHGTLAKQLDVEEEPVPVKVEALPASATVKSGEKVTVIVKVTVAAGHYLLAKRGLSIEAWGGADLRLLSTELPPPGPVVLDDGSKENGYRGIVEAKLMFELARGAAPGERAISVLVRHQVCGAGVCLPEEVTSAVARIRGVKR